MDLTLLFPCFNESENISALQHAVTEAFAGSALQIELLFVDDGSTDETFSLIQTLSPAPNQSIRAVRFSRNFGKESAIYAGLKAAQGDFIAIVDADLQQPPALVREMVEYLQTHPDCDCVTAYQESRGEGVLQSFLKRGFYRVINRVSETHFPPNASDFRTMRRAVAEAVLSLAETQRFSKGLFAWVGFSVHTIPYIAAKRHAGTSKWSLFRLFRYAFSGITSFTTAPLRIPLWLGGGTLLAALLCVIMQQFGLALLLFLSGIQLLCIGFLGEYVAKTLHESRRRPLFLIKEEYIFSKKRNNSEEKESFQTQKLNNSNEEFL